MYQFIFTEALMVMEKVAEHINEMQRIHDEYGVIFEHLFRQHFKQAGKPSSEPDDEEVSIEHLFPSREEFRKRCSIEHLFTSSKQANKPSSEPNDEEVSIGRIWDEKLSRYRSNLGGEIESKSPTTLKASHFKQANKPSSEPDDDEVRSILRFIAS